MVNVLLVQTVNSARNLDANDTPLGLAYLAGYLRVHMKDVSINIISSDEKLDFMKYKPDIVGMTSVSQNFNIAKELAAMIKKEVDLTPKGIINRLKLRRPIYQKTSAYGHFGRNEKEFTWEHLDLVPLFRKYANVK